MHGHQLRGVESSTAVKGDLLLTYVRSLPPLAGRRERRATRSTCIRRCTGSVDRPARAKACVPFSAQVPSSNRPRTPLSCVRSREEDGCAPSAFPARTGLTYRANAMRQPLRSSVPPLPAKGVAAVEDRGAFHRYALCRFREDCSSLFDQAGSPVTRYRFTPRGSDALQQGVPAPFGPLRDARRDVPSTRCGSNERNERRVASPPSEPPDRSARNGF